MTKQVKRGLLLVLVMAAVAASAGLPTFSESQELPIRRVVLYKHGVGYFERIGSMEGDTLFRLRFKAKDMSDLLKSLTVLDLGGGSIGTIAYDSTKTVDQQLREYTFDLRNAQGLPAILDQMKGSEISLTVGQTQLAGRLLSVEKRTEKTEGGGVIDRYRISVFLPDGKVKNYDLSDVTQIQFTSPEIQKEIEKYLEILFSQHRRDEKEVQIFASGRGKRDIFVSYVLEQPLWKVSYRIVNQRDEKPLLQAWAIVDNVSPEDWNQVDLSLVSGLPVSFVQNLYDPIFVRRPEIQVEREKAPGPVPAEAGLVRERAAREERMDAEKPMAARAQAARIAAQRSVSRPDLYNEIGQQAAQAIGEEAGALFVYSIEEPVTIKRDRSALLPIVNTKVDGERVEVYNESVRRENPMEAIRVRNTTGLTLEGGPITVIEGSTYAGEALISTFKPGEERYVPYAVDLGTRVSVQKEKLPEQIFRITIANGVMTRHLKLRETKIYSVQNLEEKAKTIVIEHPRQQYGWNLIGTQNPREETPNYYRFELKVPSHQEEPAKREFEVTEEITRRTEYRLVDGLDQDQIVLLLQQRLIDDKTRVFLEEISGVRAQIAALKRKVEDLQNEQKKIFDDQTRLRSNLQSLGQSEEERNLRSRIVRQLGQQEDRIEAIAKSAKDLQEQLISKQGDLSKLVLGYAFETR